MDKDYIAFFANGVELDSPTSLTVGDEKIWDKNAGRSLTAKMIGDIIARKKTFNINWDFTDIDSIGVIEENFSTVEHPFVSFEIKNIAKSKDYYSLMVYSGALKYNLELFDDKVSNASLEVVAQ